MSLLNKRHMLESIERAKASKAREHRDALPTWCPGCGHFTPLQGLYEALEQLGIDPSHFVLVSGIGCSGRFPFFVKGFGVHALHGRAIPMATGVKLANPELSVVVVGGDGDGIGIGGGHLPHAARMNIDLTYLMLDNSIYGLTKGQVSPTSPLNMISSTSPYGNLSHPLNPTTLALNYGASFVARVFSRDRDQTTDTIRQAMSHKGFSFVHVLSPCVEFNRTVTYGNIFDKAAPLPPAYEPDSRLKAIELAECEDPIYQGLLYQEDVPTCHDKIAEITSRLG